MKLQIIFGSTREGRQGEKVALWVKEQVTLHKDVELDYVDLRDLKLPFFNEEMPPAMINDGNYTNPIQKQWAERIGNADAYIIVTPEYNHSFPAVLKNALDYVYTEWNNKPVGFISYGGGASGSRAVEHLRTVVAELQMVSIRESLHLPLFQNSPFNEEGAMINPYVNQQFASFFKQLHWWSEALKTAREK